MRFLAWLLIHSVYRVRQEGLDNVPEEGPCVLVCNHVSYVDAVVIAACVRRPVRFVMDDQIFRIPLLSFIFRAMRAIPIAPAKVNATLKERAIGEAQAALAAGEVVGIFPEGRLTEDGELGPFRPGVQQIVAAVPAPIVPMALSRAVGKLLLARLPGPRNAPASRPVLADRVRRRDADRARGGNARGAAGDRAEAPGRPALTADAGGRTPVID